MNESYCYPRGGGQQGDTGTIRKNDLQTELLETMPGESIIHPVVSTQGFEIGDEVVCKLIMREGIKILQCILFSI